MAVLEHGFPLAGSFRAVVRRPSFGSPIWEVCRGECVERVTPTKPLNVTFFTVAPGAQYVKGNLAQWWIVNP
jgi:hypothetical protein